MARRRHRADLPVLRRQRLPHGRRPALLDQARLARLAPLRRAASASRRLRQASHLSRHLAPRSCSSLSALCSSALPAPAVALISIEATSVPYFRKSARRGQRSGVRIHLDPAQIGGAGAVGVDAWALVNCRTMSFSIRLRRPRSPARQIDDGRERRTFLSARDVDRRATESESHESEESDERDHRM